MSQLPQEIKNINEDTLSTIITNSISQQIIPQFMNNDSSSNLSKFIKLLILLCSKEIKTFVASFMENPFGFTYDDIKNNIRLYFYKTFEFIQDVISFRKTQKVLEDIPNKIEDDSMTLYMDIKLEPTVMNSLFQYILKHGEFDIDYDTKEIECISLRKMNVSEQYHNINFTYSGVYIEIPSITFNYTKEDTELILNNISKADTKSIKRFSDLLPQDHQFTKDLIANVDKVFQKKTLKNDCLYYNAYTGCRWDSTKYLWFLIADYLVTIYPNMDKVISTYELYVYILYGDNLQASQYICIDYITRKKKLVFAGFTLTLKDTKILVADGHKQPPRGELYKHYHSYINNYHKISEFYKYTEILSKSSKPTSICNNITFKLSSAEKCSKEEINKVFFNFLDTLSFNTSSKTKIKIYNMVFENETRTRELENPDFVAYNKQIEKLKHLDKIYSEYLQTNPLPPPETIEIKHSVKILKTKFVNETSKSMNTLYLAKQSKTKLMKVLNMFKNNKTKM